jgi:predicted nucleic acid-binding protein
MPTVILDTDFLSALLKVEQLPLVRSFYQVETLLVPPAVYRELAVTDLLPRLTELPWIRLAEPAPVRLATLQQDESFARLGSGEQEAIALALERPDAVLLMNDNQARRVATSLGVSVIHIPAFLLACKMAGLVDRDALADLIAALWEKDHYKFRQDVLAVLLG